ncbi:unnamed protein product [Rhizophagus irregularis]|nr:unnamed protein product [Rhizophagus irregularis]
MFVTCLKEKKILTKILAIAADNAANNNTFLKSLEQTCVENHIAFHHKENHPLDETIRIEPELEGFSISSNEWQTLKELCFL